MTDLEIALTIVAGVLTGVLSAVFGTGGGQISIPFMLLVLGFSQHLAEGTSLFIIVPTAAMGAWAHSRRGYVQWTPAIWLSVAGLGGAAVGALLAVRLDELLLRRFFAVFVLYAAYKFLRPKKRAGDTGQDALAGESDGPGA
jgi:uncharacterized protein